MDKFSKAKRSEIMSAIRGRDTLPEIVVRKWLHAHGFRFRVCDKKIVGRQTPPLGSLGRPRLKQLEGLADYRKGMIYAYVTGKKEVAAVA